MSYIKILADTESHVGEAASHERCRADVGRLLHVYLLLFQS